MIRPNFESIDGGSPYSFMIRKFQVKSFDHPYHFHPELELTSIVKGKGNRFVGASMAAYKDGDLILLGANLAHCWKTENEPDEDSISIVIQFRPDFLGNEFFNRTETFALKQLFARSEQGLHFIGKPASHIQARMEAMAEENDAFNRLLILLGILNDLSKVRDVQLLMKAPAAYHDLPPDSSRIMAIKSYLVENFRKRIQLDDIAAIANLSASAFCKYYKRLTRQTLMETVHNYRIDYSADLLLRSDKAVAEICFESGFEDVSYFFRIFKKKKGLSPLKYRKKFTQAVR